MSKYSLLQYLKNLKSWAELAPPLSHFLTSIVAKHQKIEAGPVGEKFFWEKVSMPEKTEKGDSL